MNILSYTSKTAIIALLSLFILNLNAFAIDPHVAVGAEGYKQDCKGHTVIVIDSGFDMNEPGLSESFTNKMHTTKSMIGSIRLHSLNAKIKKSRLSPQFNWGYLMSQFSVKDFSNPTHKTLENLKRCSQLTGITRDEIKEMFCIQSHFLHGTLVAGIIAGKGMGIAQNCNIIPIDQINRNLDSSLEITLDLVKKQPVSAVNMSLTFSKAGQPISSKRKHLISEICKHTVIFKAAGNSGTNYGDGEETKSIMELTQQCKGRLIIVGNTAYDQNNQEYLYQSSEKAGNEEYYIGAPGTNIKSYIGLGYTSKQSGTSMASPLALGVYVNILAKLQADYGDSITLDDAVKVLLTSARKESINRTTRFDQNIMGKGVVDLGYAISIAPQVLDLDEELAEWNILRDPKLEEKEELSYISYATSFLNPWAYAH